MKGLFLVITMLLFITGCVYSEHRTPYRYSSSYSTITPVYPRYQQQYYYAPAPRYVEPVPYFRAYEPHHDEHHHNHERRDYDDHKRHRSHNRNDDKERSEFSSRRHR